MHLLSKENRIKKIPINFHSSCMGVIIELKAVFHERIDFTNYANNDIPEVIHFPDRCIIHAGPTATTTTGRTTSAATRSSSRPTSRIPGTESTALVGSYFCHMFLMISAYSLSNLVGRRSIVEYPPPPKIKSPWLYVWV